MESSYVLKGKSCGNTYMRVVLDKDDMYTFRRKLDFCNFENVCVTCDKLPETSLPPLLQMVMNQFKERVRARMTEQCTSPLLPPPPSLRIGFAVADTYRRKKLDHLHHLMNFKYDDEEDAKCSVENETRYSWRDGCPVFDGKIDGIPFKFQRTQHWYASYYTVDDQQNYDSFFTDPVWDYDSDEEWVNVPP